MRKVESSITIQCPPAGVYSAFTDPEPLKGWWGVERCLVEKKQGGLYALAWEVSSKGFHYISTGVITVYNPNRELLIDHFVYFNPDKMILGPTYLNLKFNGRGNETILDLVQGGYQQGADWDWFYDAVKEAWPKALEMLKNFLERS